MQLNIIEKINVCWNFLILGLFLGFCTSIMRLGTYIVSLIFGFMMLGGKESRTDGLLYPRYVLIVIYEKKKINKKHKLLS